MAGTLNHWATSLAWLPLLIFGYCCCLCGLTYVIIAFAIRQRVTLLSEQKLPIEAVPEEGEAPPLPVSVCNSFLLHRLTSTVSRPDRGEGAFCSPSCLPGVSCNADLGDWVFAASCLVMDCIVQNRKRLCCVKVAADYCLRLHPLTSCTPCCHPYWIYACCRSPPSLRSMVGLHAWCLLWCELCRGPPEPLGFELEHLSFREGDSGSAWLSVCLGDLPFLKHSVFLEPLEGNSIFDKSVLLKVLTFFSFIDLWLSKTIWSWIFFHEGKAFSYWIFFRVELLLTNPRENVPMQNKRWWVVKCVSWGSVRAQLWAQQWANPGYFWPWHCNLTCMSM